METTGLIRNKYWMLKDYKERLDNEAFDDTSLTDEFQKEVYEYAAEVFDRENLSGVIDVGCGSGFKLIKNFPDCWTFGLDLEPTVSWLKQTYSKRNWGSLDLESKDIEAEMPYTCSALVICADVIEHIPDPDKLMMFLRNLRPHKLVLSTPDRGLLPDLQADFNPAGPPVNPCHVREWSFVEFEAYVQQFFKMDAHFISNKEQGTQVMLCSKA